MKITELDTAIQENLYQDWLNAGHEVFFDTDIYIELAKYLGIEIDRIYYNGFYSQGDGACFEGNYSYNKGWKQQLLDAGYTIEHNKDLFDIGYSLQYIQAKYFYKLTASIKHKGHYYHSGCTSISVYHDDNMYMDVDDDALSTALRDYMDYIYKDLEADYDYQTSFEYFFESSFINDLEYNEEGEVI